jgi:hypothetical protein
MVQITIALDDQGNINVQAQGAPTLVLLGLLEVARDAIKAQAAKEQQAAQKPSGLVLPRGPFNGLRR